jgi:hypothetical protein
MGKFAPLALLDLSFIGIADSSLDRNSNTSNNSAMVVAKPLHAVIGLLVK